MHSTNTTQELVDLEKRYWKAMDERDLKTAMSLTDFPCIVAGPQGMRSVNEEQYEKLFNSPRDEIRDLRFGENPEVRLIGPDTAVIAYELKYKTIAGGKEKVHSAVDTSTWIKRDGKWACSMHTETEINPNLNTDT